MEMSSSFVNLGAADGIWQDPLHDFLVSPEGQDARGVAIEGDPERCKEYLQNWGALYHTVICDVLMLKSWNEMEDAGQKVNKALLSLRAMQARPLALDVIKIDLDSSDCWIISHWLQSFLPLRAKIILVEAHPLPPPFKFSLWDPGGLEELQQAGGGDGGSESTYRSRLNLGLYGCSLSAWVHLLEPFGYRLLSFRRKDASFVHESLIDRAFPEANGGSSEFACYEASMPYSSGFTPVQLRSWFYSADTYKAFLEVQADLRSRVASLRSHHAEDVSFILTV